MRRGHVRAFRDLGFYGPVRSLLCPSNHGSSPCSITVPTSGRNGRAGRGTGDVGASGGPKPVTAGGDKCYDTFDFVSECRNLGVTPHVAQNDQRRGGSAIDERTTRHPGYGLSQIKRKRIEECFGWLKTIALLRKVRHRGVCKVDWIFTFACAAYNLVRMRNLAAVVLAV